MAISLTLILLGAALIAAVAFEHLIHRRAIVRPPAPPPILPRYPSVTMIRPIKGLDVDAKENFRAALDTGYPGEVETLFILDDVTDPAYPVAQEVVREHTESGRPGRAEVLVSGTPPRDSTGKLHAMIVGAARARGELVAFGDSDTRPDRHVLRLLVEKLVTTPDAGDTFAPVVVSNPATASGDVGYGMLVNGWYGPSVARVAARDGGSVPFIMGQIMVFKREALADIGGVACARGQLVDDIYIGQCVARAGWKNYMITHPLHIVARGNDVAQFVRHFRRWLLFSRNGIPFDFTWPNWLRGLIYWSSAIGVIAGLATGHPLAALAPALAYVAATASGVSLQRRFGGASIPARFVWMAAALPLLAPFILASTVVKKVDWRGRTYDLGWQAKLAA